MNANDPTNNFGLKGFHPEGVKTYVQAHNGPKISDLYNQTYSIINEGIPPSTDTKVNGQRQQLMSAAKNGDQSAISTAKNLILTNLQKQVEKVKTESIKAAGTTGATYFDPSPAQKEVLDGLNKKIQSTTNTLNDFAINAAANSKETQTQIKAEVSGSQRGSTPNIAAEDLGKQVEKIQGGLSNPNGNIQYERQRIGFETLINNKQLKINDLMMNGLKSKNQAMLSQAQKEQAEMEVLQNKAGNLINQFPDVATTQVARIIGDEIAESHPLNWVISKSDVLESAQRIEKKHPGFNAKYGKFINSVAESEGEGLFGQFKEGLVPKGGFSGGFNAGANDLMYGGAGFVAKVLGDKKTKEHTEAMQDSFVSKGTKGSGVTPTKVSYDDKGKAFVEKPNEDYGKINWNSGPRFAGQSLPGLAAWLAPETGAAGLAELAGAGKAAQTTFGLIAASYYTGYNDNYKLAESLIEDDSSMGTAKKVALANMTTLLTAGTFKLIGYSPSKFVENAMTKAIAPDILNALEESGYRQLPKNKVHDLLVNTILPKANAFSVETAKALGEGAKVSAAQVADTKINEFISKVINPNRANATTTDENIKSFVQQALFMTVVGTLAGFKPAVAGFNTPMMKDAMYEIGTRAPQYIDRINAAVQDGTYTQEQANKMIQATKTIGEEVAKVQTAKNKDNLDLTIGQKTDIAVANFRKRMAEGLKDAGVDVKISNDADQTIKDAQSKNTHLPLEETEAFKTANEVDKEGNEIGKPKSVEDIEGEKEYKYYKNGREETTSGPELISHLPESREYDSEVQVGKYKFINYDDLMNHDSGADYLSKLEKEGKIKIEC